MKMGVGLSGIGVAIPRTRLTTRDIHTVWQNVPWAVVERTGVIERTVCEPDMDSLTLAADAGRRALASSGEEDIDAIFLGTQTSPYLTRSSAGVLVDMLGIGPKVFACDVQFAGKSGTSAIAMAAAWVGSELGSRALAIGSDTLGVHAAPGDPFEYVAGSAAGACVIDRRARIATLDGIAAYTSDTPDGHRLDGERFIHRGGATMNVTDVGYPSHARGAWSLLCAQDQFVVSRMALQQPDASQPRRIATMLGMSGSVLEGTLVADRVGDVGSASVLLALARLLATARAGDRVGIVSYGVGAGSDAFLLTITQQAQPTGIDHLLNSGLVVDYATAVRYERRYQSHPRLATTFE